MLGSCVTLILLLLLLFMMKFLVRNVRGAGSRTFPHLIRDLRSRHGLDAVILLETRLSGSKADHVICGMGFLQSFKYDAVGFSGGIWLRWDDGAVNLQILRFHKQYIHTKISFPGMETWLFIAVYGSPQLQLREELWSGLRNIAMGCIVP